MRSGRGVANRAPIVGIDAVVIPDTVQPGKAGWSAETGNARFLQQAIETALENDGERQRMGRRCREVVEEEYMLHEQARRYEALYESILSDRCSC